MFLLNTLLLEQSTKTSPRTLITRLINWEKFEEIIKTIIDSKSSKIAIIEQLVSVTIVMYRAAKNVKEFNNLQYFTYLLGSCKFYRRYVRVLSDMENRNNSIKTEHIR